MLTVLGFVTVALAVLVAKRVLADGGWVLALALVVPITYATSHVTGDISSIASVFQDLAIQLLSGFLIAAIGPHDLMLTYRGTLRARRLVAIAARRKLTSGDGPVDRAAMTLAFLGTWWVISWLVLSTNALAAFGPGVCSRYHAVSVQGLMYGQLQELR